MITDSEVFQEIKMKKREKEEKQTKKTKAKHLSQPTQMTRSRKKAIIADVEDQLQMLSLEG